MAERIVGVQFVSWHVQLVECLVIHRRQSDLLLLLLDHFLHFEALQDLHWAARRLESTHAATLILFIRCGGCGAPGNLFSILSLVCLCGVFLVGGGASGNCHYLVILLLLLLCLGLLVRLLALVNVVACGCR